MGIWQSISGLFRASPKVELAPGGVIPATLAGRGPARRGTRELIASFREQPWLRAVTWRIANAVATTTWRVSARAEAPAPQSERTALAPVWKWGRDKGVRDFALMSSSPEARAAHREKLQSEGLLRDIPDHPLLGILQRPNPEMTGHTFLVLTQIWLDIKGEAFWLKSYNEKGTLTGLWPVPPHWVTQMPTSVTPYYRVSIGATQLEVVPTAMVWLRNPDPENPYGRGTGIAEALGDELETDEYAAKYLKAWFFNNAMPNVIVSFGADVTQEQLKRFKQSYLEDHRGTENSHRAFFASGSATVTKLDSSFRDQQIPELRRLQRDTIVQVFAVPPELVGIIENSNRSTIGAAQEIFTSGVVRPRCFFLTLEIEHQLGPDFETPFCLECVLPIPPDPERRLSVMKALPGGFSVNEWRAEAGFKPAPEFDGVYPALAMPGQQPATEEPGAAEQPEEEPVEDNASEDLEGEAARVAPVDPPWAKSRIV